MKHLMILLALALAAVALAAPGHATILTVSCTPAIKNTNGSAFATGATAGFNLYGAYTGAPLALLNPTPSTTCLWVRQNVNPGSIVYAVTQLEQLAGVWGPESAQTAPITTVVPAAAPTPGSPTISLASTSTIVYMLVPGANTYGPIIVGSAPLGTPCDATKPLLIYYPIPTSAVTFTGKIKSPVTVTTCQ